MYINQNPKHGTGQLATSWLPKLKCIKIAPTIDGILYQQCMKQYIDLCIFCWDSNARGADQTSEQLNKSK
jgi:hypothetical protein